MKTKGPMNSTRPPRLPRSLVAQLNGLDWRLEQSRKHWLLSIEGELVAILPRGRLGESPKKNNHLVRKAVRIIQEIDCIVKATGMALERR